MFVLRYLVKVSREAQREAQKELGALGVRVISLPGNNVGTGI